MPIDSYYLQSQIDDLKRKVCCCEGDVGITTLSPPVTAPTTNGAKILVNLTTGVGYYWDGDSWEIAFTALPNQAQIKTTEVDITSDQLKAMSVTPVVLLQGVAGKVHSLIKVEASFTYGGTAYTGGGNLSITDSISLTGLTRTILTSSQFTGTSDIITTIGPIALTTAQVQGLGADIQTSLSAPLFTGNGTLKLFITYQTITV